MAEAGTRDVWFEGAFMRVQVSADDSGGSVSIMEQWIPADWSPPTHCHHREDQVLYVLEGELHARLGDGPVRVAHAGESVFLPRGVPHGFVTGPDGARFLEINTPGGFEQFHVDAGDPAPEARIPDPPDGIDVPRLLAAVEPYDVDFVGPPMTR